MELMYQEEQVDFLKKKKKDFKKQTKGKEAKEGKYSCTKNLSCNRRRKKYY